MILENVVNVTEQLSQAATAFPETMLLPADEVVRFKVGDEMLTDNTLKYLDGV